LAPAFDGQPNVKRQVSGSSPIVDEHTRECLGGLVERWVSADRLIDEHDRIAVQRGYPAALRCDNGPELAATRCGIGW
jgi:hypothetical protein